MAKRVDYSSRFEFLRQASFALVLGVGVHALTLRALAAELGIGVNTVRRLVDPATDLAVLAGDEVRTRRRRDRWGRLPDDRLAAAQVLIRRLLPDEESRIDEELVWLRLVASHGLAPRDPDARHSVLQDFQRAERGWSDRDLERDAETTGVNETTTAPGGPAEQNPHGAMSHHFSARRSEVDSLIERIMELLEVQDAHAAGARLTALVEGLTWAVCTGRIGPSEALAAVDRQLAELETPTARVAG